jgi:RNA polymerase sigma-70 factor (ECF subfamily)
MNGKDYSFREMIYDECFSTGKEFTREQLMEIVDTLPDDERMLLTLYYFEDRPLTEIAYITGIEASALANRLYRTRKKLYKKLQ